MAHRDLLKVFQIFLALSLFVAMPAVSGTQIQSPQNPTVSGNAAFISFEGVRAYGGNDLQPLWEALLGEHTFEPVIHRHLLLVGSSRGLFALHTGDGRVLWHVASSSDLFTPVVADGIAYAGSRDGTLYALDAISGQERWRTQFPGWIYSPAFIDGTLATGGQDATLWAIDASNGERIWSRALPGELVFSPLVGASSTFLVMTFASDLIAFDAANGLQQWQLQTPTASMTATAWPSGIFLTGFDNGLRKVDPESGALEWATLLDGRLSPPQLIDSDHVLVSNDEGKLFVLRAGDGAKVGEARFAASPVGRPFLSRGQVVQFVHKSGQLSVVAATVIPAANLAEK
jgi:outer membrane protein assembly factor BamB